MRDFFITKQNTAVTVTLLFAALVLSNPDNATAERTSEDSNDRANVYFISPAPDSVVASPVTVRFGLRHMGIAPAGIAFPSTGHHHLLVDQEIPSDLTLPLPSTEKILHFGKGQTEVELALPPGEHRLQLLLGDHLHRPHRPPVLSEPIHITVQ